MTTPPPLTVQNGTLLIAEPFLGDTNFERSVVLVCQHQDDEGTFGLVLNQTTNFTLAEVVKSVYVDMPLYLGGPVQQNTLHFIHRRPDLIDGSIRVADGLYWSGNFAQLTEAVNLGTVTEGDARFFIGYSGWDAGQLAEELDKKSWYISYADADFVFDTPTQAFWREVLKRMGGQFRSIAHYPTDPRLN